MFDIKEIFSVTLILFSVIDILGSTPIIINLRKRLAMSNPEELPLQQGF